MLDYWLAKIVYAKSINVYACRLNKGGERCRDNHDKLGNWIKPKDCIHMKRAINSESVNV
jgi:hypothetical protein